MITWRTRPTGTYEEPAGLVLEAILRFQPDEAGRALHLVTAVNDEAFVETWIGAVEAAQGRTASRRRP